MTFIARASAFVRAFSACEAGSSTTRLALVIGLSASALLILVRVGTAVAAVQ